MTSTIAGYAALKIAIALTGLCLSAALLFVRLTRVNQFSLGKRMNWAAPPGENYDQAAFRLWYPAGIPSVRGVVVLVPGSNQDGRSQIEDEQWRALAIRHNLALIGCYLSDKPHPDMRVEAYVDVSRGSGDALLDALSELGRRLSHPELASAPLLLWGMSAGGEFNYEFAAWKPDRVAGFVVNKGGVYYSDLLPPESRRVPGLFFVGGNDLQYRQDAIRRIFQINHEAGASWTLIEEPEAGHEIGKSKEIAQSFFASVMAPASPGDGTGPNIRKLTPAGSPSIRLATPLAVSSSNNPHRSPLRAAAGSGCLVAAPHSSCRRQAGRVDTHNAGHSR